MSGILKSSIGLRSEFLLLDHISQIERREGYMVVKTLKNPRYVSANFILFERPPSSEDFKIWPELFKEEFRTCPEVRSMKLSWPSSNERVGEFESFLKNGFELEFYQALVGDSVKMPENLNAELDVRELDVAGMPKMWDQICQDQMVFRPEGLSVEYYEKFAEALMRDYKGLIEKGICKWFGGFCNEKLVSSVGILWNDEMVAFQRVLVQPEYQTRGFCRAMLYRVGGYVRENLKGRKIVSLAEKGSNATKVYESLGLEIVEDLLSLYCYAKSLT